MGKVSVPSLLTALMSVEPQQTTENPKMDFLCVVHTHVEIGGGHRFEVLRRALCFESVVGRRQARTTSVKLRCRMVSLLPSSAQALSRTPCASIQAAHSWSPPQTSLVTQAWNDFVQLGSYLVHK